VIGTVIETVIETGIATGTEIVSETVIVSGSGSVNEIERGTETGTAAHFHETCLQNRRRHDPVLKSEDLLSLADSRNRRRKHEE